MPANTKSFTREHTGLAHVLITESGISSAFDTVDKNYKPQFKRFNSIWDTGATNSAISQKVVDECGLIQTGVTEVSHVKGSSLCPTYLVSILLRNNVGFSQVRVTLATLGPDADVLIGMDIITQGDFVITNKDSKTVFSFRIPSTECIDFTGKMNSAKAASAVKSDPYPGTGRNAPCPCGKPKKRYKNCCGKTR
jgi:hypothetical protein